VSGLADRFFDAAREHLERFRSSSGPALLAAAELTAERVAAGGAIHHFDTGHTAREPIDRAGGFVGLHGIKVAWSLEHRLPPGREGKGLLQSYVYDVEALGSAGAARCNLARGDVHWRVSNSGKEPFRSRSRSARASSVRGGRVTSVPFSRSVPARHASGKRVFEVADVVLDTMALRGRRRRRPGAPTPSARCRPLNIAAVWALTAATTEAAAAGHRPGRVPQREPARRVRAQRRSRAPLPRTGHLTRSRRRRPPPPTGPRR
jgi:uncharacterized phosphosugar-binding protein